MTKSTFAKSRPNFDKPMTKVSTIMIYNLIRITSLLSNLVERQNAEIEMLNERIGAFLHYIENKNKYTNKKYKDTIRSETNSYNSVKREH
tara:strand:+ start:254 stop:523 length:270 start_codon:yes stop_codon:yes gene_type:complete